MSKITTLVAKISKAREQLKQMEAEYAELRLEALRTVTLTKVGETFTLEYKSRIIKAKKGRHGFKVTEGKTVLLNEFGMGGIHDIRYMVATSKI